MPPLPFVHWYMSNAFRRSVRALSSSSFLGIVPLLPACLQATPSMILCSSERFPRFVAFRVPDDDPPSGANRVLAYAAFTGTCGILGISLGLLTSVLYGKSGVISFSFLDCHLLPNIYGSEVSRELLSL